jgi:class 3 adenylate cyclase
MTHSENSGDTMDQVLPSDAEEVAVVSCDIRGHSDTHGVEQVRRVAAINGIVAATMRRNRPDQVVWLSGGDGGHVVFRGDRWQESAIRLVWNLRSWARADHVKLRITGHVGRVTSIWGADGRVQLVGSGVNFAGWLLRQADSDVVVVSDAFRRCVATVCVNMAVSCHDERFIPDRNAEPQSLYLMSLAGFRSTWPEAEQTTTFG